MHHELAEPSPRVHSNSLCAMLQVVIQGPCVACILSVVISVSTTGSVLNMSPHLACGCKGRHLQVVQRSLPDEPLLPGQGRLALTLHAVKVLQQLCVFLHLF